MKKFLTGLMLLLSVILPAATTITKDLSTEISHKKLSDKIRINIVMREQYDQQKLISATGNSSKAIAREIVKSELKNFSRVSQSSILSQIGSFEASNEVTTVKPLWISNVINCQATPAAIAELAKRDDVESIDFDEERNLVSSERRTPQKRDYSTPVTSGKDITTNVTKINADQVWTAGFTGQGVLVGLVDSGVNYNHIDLKDHMWDGGTQYPNHGYDFANSDNNPMDDLGHGTHCAGTVAGDGTGAYNTGAAPDATIMAVKILTGTGTGTESGVWQGLQFCIDHNVDLISMSIGWQPSYNPNRKIWRNIMNNALASGILAVVAAGNSGEDANSNYTPENPGSYGTSAVPWNVSTPGDCPPPWLHPDQTLTGGLSAVLSVGATDIDDYIASFSSNGPVPWNLRVTDYTDYAYIPGSTSQIGLIRPDVVAPGVDIKSCLNTSNTGYQTMSGTSMATPLTAGVVALMISKNSNITPSEICRILQEQADIKPDVKSNFYGAGRINALNAVRAVPIVQIPFDAGVNAITSPVSGANLTNAETVTAVIKNYGTEAISSGLTISYKLDNGTAVDQIYTGSAIQLNDSVNFSFTQKADLSAGGLHTVKVYTTIASDINTYNDSKTIEVTNSAPFVLPFLENFESETFPPANWAISNPDSGITWERKIATGNDISTHAAYVNFWNYSDAAGAKDELVTPVISLADAPSCELTFNVAYRQYEAENDGLKIYISTDSGSTFNATPIFDKCGTTLATTTASTAQFTPNIADNWRLETINLNSYIGSSIVLKFESINQYGNNMYIDDVRLEELQNGIETGNIISETTLSQNYPNPFNPETTIKFNIINSGLVNLAVYNTKGEIVQELINGKQTAGLHSVKFNAARLNSGVYFYKLITPEKTITQKMLLVK